LTAIYVIRKVLCMGNTSISL